MGLALPTGTVTFLFTDLEGSTRLLEQVGPDAYADALSEHRRIIEAACAERAGVVVDSEGDAVFVAFRTAPDALGAARVIEEDLAAKSLRVRIGVHTGTALVSEAGYIGMDVHRAARIAAAAHGGQIVLSASTRSLLPDDRLSGLAVRDLGEHRLKDLSAAERLFQLGDGEFPPLRSLKSTNLPVPATPFLGRDQELAEVQELLRRPEARMVSLIGPGGTGKTRLALQAAAEVSDEFPDGVWWTPLAPLAERRLILTAIAQTLGVAEEPGRGLGDTVAARLQGKRLLVVVDNAEHLLPEVAPELASLVASCPTLKLLVTSRERLRVAAEAAWPVPPLAKSDGEQLFVERARAVGVRLAADRTISELCGRLDELPLAIELAAARTVVFSPEQLLERLSQRLDLLEAGRDADSRQRTLRSTIDWSYDLLSPDEQRVFNALSVFTGGCTFPAAEEVVGADPDTLQSLLDKSLLRRGDREREPRYWMLDTIRGYAAEKLERADDPNQYHRRHAEWSLRLAGGLLGFPGPTVQRVAAAAELVRFRDDYANARSAIAWSWAAGDDELGLGLGAASSRFWFGEGLFRDATMWLREATPRIEAASAEIRLQALKVSGLLAFFIRADSEQADVLWAEARAVADELSLDDEAAWIDHMRAGVAWERGDLEGAAAWLERLLAYHRATGNRLAEADMLHSLGDTRRDLGDFAAAERHLIEAETIYREIEATRGLQRSTHHSLADLALDRGDYASAIVLYRESMDVAHSDERFLAYCLAGMASALAELDRLDDGALLWGAVCATEESRGFRMVAAERRRYQTHVARLEGSDAWNEGRSLSLTEAVDRLEPLP
jgi:predicted ATPase/class 3 adenylate cyclase